MLSRAALLPTHSWVTFWLSCPGKNVPESITLKPPWLLEPMRAGVVAVNFILATVYKVFGLFPSPAFWLPLAEIFSLKTGIKLLSPSF